MLRRWGISGILVFVLGCGGSVASDGAGIDAGAGAGGLGGTSSGGGGGTPSGGGGGASIGGAGGSGAVGGCAAPAPGQIDGDYLLTLSLALEPTKPILFSAKLTTDANAGPTGVRWTLQALLWSDRKTPVGDPVSMPAGAGPAMPIDPNGSFHAKLPALTLVGEANPLSHSPITVELTLDAKLCSGASFFFCGTAGGDVTKPILLELEGSTWTLEKISPGLYPEPPHIDCAMNQAAPVGSLQ